MAGESSIAISNSNAIMLRSYRQVVNQNRALTGDLDAGIYPLEGRIDYMMISVS